MKILLIKLSSMGDVLHTLPALTDAANAIPHLTVDWVVDQAFSAVPCWHPTVRNVITIPLRQWKKKFSFAEFKHFYKTIRAEHYDLIIDAQGLLKSAIITAFSRGKKAGLDKHSAWEPIASYFYTKKCAVNPDQHAITRVRTLLAKALNYPLPTTAPDYHIDPTKLPTLSLSLEQNYGVFLHGTTWASKHYPENYWRALLEKCEAAQQTVYLPWGNNIEKTRAETLAKNLTYAHVLPKLSISEMATVLKNATTVVAVDTGFGHLCAALGTPTVSLYGATNAAEIGTQGNHQTHLSVHFPCAPCKKRECFYAKTHSVDIVPTCFSTLPPETVWATLKWQR